MTSCMAALISDSQLLASFLIRLLIRVRHFAQQVRHVQMALIAQGLVILGGRPARQRSCRTDNSHDTEWSRSQLIAEVTAAFGLKSHVDLQLKARSTLLMLLWQYTEQASSMYSKHSHDRQACGNRRVHAVYKQME